MTCRETFTYSTRALLLRRGSHLTHLCVIYRIGRGSVTEQSPRVKKPQEHVSLDAWRHDFKGVNPRGENE